MTAIEATYAAVVVVLVLGFSLLAGVIGLKWAHRRRVQAHNKRRRSYLRLLSAHLVSPTPTLTLDDRQFEDDAFIDAVIDIRNTVAGDSAVVLKDLIDGRGLINLQAARLRSPFPLGRRLRAVVSLAEIGDQAAGRVLMQHLSDREPEVRIHSARGLARMRYLPAIEPMLERMRYESPLVRSKFGDALIAFGTEASWPMVGFVRVHQHDDDTTGLPEIIRAIGRIGEREVGPALSELLHELENVEICLAIIESLGSIGGPRSLRPLRKTFCSDDWRIRAKAASAMGEIGDPSVNPILFQALGDSSWWTRRNSAGALAVLPGGINWLYDGLISHDEFARDAAAEALADCGELSAAKLRFDSGEGGPRDLRLIRYMDRPGLVFS